MTNEKKLDCYDYFLSHGWEIRRKNRNNLYLDRGEKSYRLHFSSRVLRFEVKRWNEWVLLKSEYYSKVTIGAEAAYISKRIGDSK